MSDLSPVLIHLQGLQGGVVGSRWAGMEGDPIWIGWETPAAVLLNVPVSTRYSTLVSVLAASRGEKPQMRALSTWQPGDLDTHPVTYMDLVTSCGIEK